MKLCYAIPAAAIAVAIPIAGLAYAQTSPGTKLDCDVVTSDAVRLTLDCVPVTEVPPSTTLPDTSTSSSPTTVPETVPETDPSTTTVPATTTPPPTTTSPTSSSVTPTTTTQPATTTTQPSGVVFSDDFSTPGFCGVRYDCGWSGEVQAGALFGDAAQDWHGDHDMNCGDPNTTSRTIHVTPPAGEPGAPSGASKDVSQVFYYCAPGNDPAKGHVMTSANTEGYVTVWFSPKQVFTNVHRVCWDVNLTDPVGSMWVAVNFLTPAEYQGETDLGYTTPEFPSNPSSPQGAARNGISTFNGFRSYTDGQFHGGPGNPGGIVDKAARYKHCVVDNDNGTLTLTQARPGGVTATVTTAGAIPNGNIRVEFAHDEYNPDKHQVPSICRDCGPEYTWHWDNISVS